jgi:hypothetical protein
MEGSQGMTLPKTLKINGFDWKVEESKSVAMEGNAFGSTHFREQVIYLDPSITDQKKKQCLLHEIMHAVSWQSGLDKRINDDKLEEEIVTSLSFGLYQVLSDNGMLTGFGEKRSNK